MTPLRMVMVRDQSAGSAATARKRAALAQVGQLFGERPGCAALDVPIAGFAVCVHGTALENIYERVGVTGKVCKDMAPGPAGQP